MVGVARMKKESPVLRRIKRHGEESIRENIRERERERESKFMNKI